MNAVYIESSSLLAWVLGEPKGSRITSVLNQADLIATSVLTLLETERGLIRAEKEGILTSADRQKLKGLLAKSAAHWTRLEITEEVQARAKDPFPIEPLRTLDAIHLASILELIKIFPELAVLSQDQRILANLEPLGLKAII